MVGVMRLTPLEKDILNHRLEVPDAIADYLTSGPDTQFAEADISAMCSKLLTGDYDAAIASDKALAHAVLQDAVEGSTYLGASIGNVSIKEEMAIRSAGNSLAGKVGDLIGKDIYYPRG